MDLDELERVVDDLPGELWRARYTAETATVYVDGCDGQVDPIFSVSDHEDHHDIAALVVLRNAAPGLTREVRKLRADLAAAQAEITELRRESRRAFMEGYGRAHVRYANVEEFLREVIRREEKAHDAWRATADENGMIKTACPEAERVYALSPLAAMARVLLGEEE